MTNTIKNEDGFYYVETPEVLDVQDDFEIDNFKAYCEYLKYQKAVASLSEWSGKPLGTLKPKHRKPVVDNDDLPF